MELPGADRFWKCGSSATGVSKGANAESPPHAEVPCRKMYISSLRRVGAASRPRVHLRPRVARPLLPLGPSPGTHSRTTSVRGISHQPKSATTAAVEGAEAAWRSAKSKFKGWAKVPSASSVAGAVALVPVVGGAWLVTVYALRQRLCEHRLQQVEGDGSAGLRRRIRNGGGGGGRGHTAQPPLFPGSSADARGLRELLELPARGVTVLSVDPPASYTGEAFLRSALLGRAATVHIHAGEGDGDLAVCLARGLGVQFMSAKLQLSALWPGLADQQGRRGAGVARAREGELSDIGAILDTATAALEEIRDQAYDPRDHLPPVIVVDGLLGRIRPGEGVPAAVEAVLRWCWTVTGGRRLAHVVMTAPQSMVVDGSLVRVKAFLNDGRPSPGMMRVVGLDAPNRKVTERRFRSRLSRSTKPTTDDAGGAAASAADDGKVERAVTLCMELVHGEGCGVAEEANVVLRRAVAADDKKGKQPSSELSALNGALESIALEAWRRTAAAVSGVASASIVPDNVTTTSSLPLEKVEGNEDYGLYIAAGGVSNGGESEELTSGLMVDDYMPLEATDRLSRAVDEQRVGRRSNAFGVFLDSGASCSDVSGASSLEDAVPATPLGRLVKLMGELTDGRKVTLGRAVSVLNGDGKALGRLLDLGVLRLSPKTVSGTVSAAGADVARSSDVLPEAGEAFQVGAATPVMAGVFAILRGFHGREEQAIARAMYILRGGNPGGFATGLADSEEWQAHREAAMAGLVRRALSGYGRAERVGAKAGNFSSRRLQVALAAVGCMVTRREIEAASRQEHMTQAALVPALLSAYHRGQHPVRVQIDPGDLVPSIPVEATDGEGGEASKIPDSLEEAGASSGANAASQVPEDSEELYYEDVQAEEVQEVDSAECVVESVGDSGGSDVEDQQEDVEVHDEDDAEQSASAADREAESPPEGTDVQKSGPEEFDAPASGDEADGGLVMRDEERDESNREVVEDDAVPTPAEGEPVDARLAEGLSSTTQAESTESSSALVSSPDSAVVNQRIPSDDADAEKEAVVVPPIDEGGADSSDAQDEDQTVPVSDDDDSTASRAEGDAEEDSWDDQSSEVGDDLVASDPHTSTSSEGTMRRWMNRFWPGSGKNGRA